MRRDGKLGEQIKQAGTECLPMTPVAGAPPPPPPPQGPGVAGAPQCPSLLSPGNISGRKLTVDRLAATLSLFLNRDIRNQSNLDGLFNIDLRWIPDQAPFLPAGALPPPLDTNAPPLFTALQEQLGLRLDSQRGPVDVLVIDEVSKPSAD